MDSGQKTEASERLQRPAVGEPTHGDLIFNIAVLFTTWEETAAALRRAHQLAGGLNARIKVLVMHLVPYPLELSTPSITPAWTERHLQVLFEQSPTDISVMLYLCRDEVETLRSALDPHSLVVIGRKRWHIQLWKGRLEKELERAGHQVVIVRVTEHREYR